MSTEKSELRPLCQVQHAHDVLFGILLEPDLCPPAGPERNALVGAADVLCWVLQHDHNVTFDTDQQLDLQRMIRITLREQGPMPFGCLHDMICKGLSIAPHALHDLLNNMIAAGLVQISPAGCYLQPS